MVNVTPDSFSDGGRFLDAGAAIRHGRELLEAGADIVDIGGESTRPGAQPVSVDEELARVIPVVQALAADGALVSIDTRHALVMKAAIAAGAAIINDITALTGDPDALRLLGDSDASVVLMHMQGQPASMQLDPRYDCASSEVRDYLRGRLEACRAAGIADRRLCLDPGIGFGKTLEHNLEILADLGRLVELGVAVLVGVSRKSFISRLSGGVPADQRLPGSLAAALAAVSRGAHILRVHDVAETAQALAVWRAINWPLSSAAVLG